MSTESSARRNWIKNAAIIFLVILLLLTFFSKTILDYSLPEVSAQYTQYATLSSSVKVSGTVKANASYNVVYEADAAEAENGTIQSRKVISVYVKEGDTVEKDAPILSLKGGASDQLTALRQQYDELKRTYDLALLDDSVSSLEAGKTLDDAKKAISDAKDELSDLKKELTAVKGGSDTTTILEDAIDRLNDQLEALQEKQGEAQKMVSEVEGKISAAEAMIEEDVLSSLTVAEKLAIAESDYAVLEESYNSLKAQTESAKEYLDRVTSSSGDIGAANELTATIKTLEDQLYDLEKKRERYIEDFYNQNDSSNADYWKLMDDYVKAQADYEDALRYFGNDDLESLQKEAERAQNNYNQLLSYRSAYENAVSNLDLAEESLKSATVGQSTAETNYSTAVNSGDEDKISAAGEALESANSVVMMFQTDVNNWIKKVAAAQIDNPTDTAIDSAESAMEKANSALQAAQSDNSELSSLKAAMDAAESALEAAGYTSPDTLTYDRTLEDYDDQIYDLERQIRDAKDKLTIIGLPEVDDVIDYAMSYDLAEAQKNYDKASANLADVTSKYEEAKAKVESLRKQNSAQGVVWEYKGLLSTYEAQVKSLNDQIKQTNKQIEAKQKELSKTDAPKDPDEIEKQIKDKEDLIADLQSQLTITEATQSRTDTTTTLERGDQKKQLLELEEKIAAYQDAPETTDVTAPIGGRIVSVNFVPGDTVSSGNTVASIEIADKGYVVEISMAAEEARKIQVGSPCTVSNSWWYSNVEAAVTQIRSDPQSQGKNRIIVIEVKGDVYEGQSLKFSIGDRSQSYDSVLPNSAIRQDSDGNFVLTVESKKTPLGMRYTAKRVPVEILASDDTQSAVSGLYGSEFVITNATSPISDKQQVRLAGN